MEFKAMLESITRNIKDNRFMITFSVEAIPEGIASLQEKLLTVTAKVFRNKRSLNANAYYWRLVCEISRHLQTPNAYTHNFLLRRYGTLENIEGENILIFIPDTQESEEKVMLQEAYHLKPTSRNKITDDGRVFRAYLVIKGSSYYDTLEMSRLIDGAVSEAKEMGIETLPPDEIERMMAAYEEHSANRQ